MIAGWESINTGTLGPLPKPKSKAIRILMTCQGCGKITVLLAEAKVSKHLSEHGRFGRVGAKLLYSHLGWSETMRTGIAFACMIPLISSALAQLERGKAYSVRLVAGSQSVEAKALAESKSVTIALPSFFSGPARKKTRLCLGRASKPVARKMGETATSFCRSVKVIQ
jgi:hypothetical protein